MIKISIARQEVAYRGYSFTFNQLKRVVLKAIPHEFIASRCIHRRFNSKTGEIERKYAWDGVLEDLKDAGVLAVILDELIETEIEDDS